MIFHQPRPFREEKVISPPVTREVVLFRDLLESRDRPIDLEIGCGVGWHPIRYALENPARSLIAIEQTSEKFAKFQNRISSHLLRDRSVENLLAVHADAVAWITSFVPDQSISRIFILYPNPSPKNAAARWIRMPFFSHLIKKVRPRGEVHFRTNREDYAEEVREFGARFWGLNPVVDRVFSRHDVPLADARTHFERKYLAAGEKCAEIIFRINSPSS